MSQVEQCLRRACAVIEGDVWIFDPRGMLRSFAARGVLFEVSMKQVHVPRGKLNV